VFCDASRDGVRLKYTGGKDTEQDSIMKFCGDGVPVNTEGLHQHSYCYNQPHGQLCVL
jgi:hypothetical protein